MATRIIDQLRRAFRMGPTPRRVDRDAAYHLGLEGDVPHNRLIAYVRHNYTNYDRVRVRIPHSQVDHWEFKDWVNGEIEAALLSRDAKGNGGR